MLTTFFAVVAMIAAAFVGATLIDRLNRPGTAHLLPGVAVLVALVIMLATALIYWSSYGC